MRMDEILQEARTTQGVKNADEIEYAVLERSGAISIVPKKG
ncbi:YetF domain-containing protein [Pseudonocardia nigra]